MESHFPEASLHAAECVLYQSVQTFFVLVYTLMSHKYQVQVLLSAAVGQLAHILQCLHVSGKMFCSVAFHILAELIKNHHNPCKAILFRQLSSPLPVNAHGV